MIDLNTVHDAIADAIDQAKARKNSSSLADLQVIAGYLMKPADDAGDKETTFKFRVLAAKAANIREELGRSRDDD